MCYVLTWTQLFCWSFCTKSTIRLFRMSGKLDWSQRECSYWMLTWNPRLFIHNSQKDYSNQSQGKGNYIIINYLWTERNLPKGNKCLHFILFYCILLIIWNTLGRWYVFCYFIHFLNYFQSVVWLSWIKKLILSFILKETLPLSEEHILTWVLNGFK